MFIEWKNQFVKMSILIFIIYKINAVLVKIMIVFFTEIEKIYLQIKVKL